MSDQMSRVMLFCENHIVVASFYARNKALTGDTGTRPQRPSHHPRAAVHAFQHASPPSPSSPRTPTSRVRTLPLGVR